MLYTAFRVFTDLRDKMHECKDLQDFIAIAKEVKERRGDWLLKDKIGWYNRYR